MPPTLHRVGGYCYAHAMPAETHKNPVVELIAKAIWEASDEHQDDPDVKWEDNYARTEVYRQAEAVVGSGQAYYVTAEAETPGNVASWVGDYDTPTTDYPEWLNEVQTGMTNAVIGWGREDDVDGDLPDKIMAFVMVEPEW